MILKKISWGERGRPLDPPVDSVHSSNHCTKSKCPCCCGCDGLNSLCRGGWGWGGGVLHNNKYNPRGKNQTWISELWCFALWVGNAKGGAVWSLCPSDLRLSDGLQVSLPYIRQLKHQTQLQERNGTQKEEPMTEGNFGRCGKLHTHWIGCFFFWVAFRS